MVKFTKEPKLNKAEKQFVLEELKSLLKQNRLEEIREILYNLYNYGDMSFDSLNNIVSFLLFHLQDDYFKDCNIIFDSEFIDFDIIHIDIPEGITEIGNSAFTDCSSMTSITIPRGITKIEDYVFSGCYNLTSITIPEGVKHIGKYAFWNCGNLKEVIIPKSVTRIGNSAFESCTSLRSITIPKNCKLGEYTFEDDVEIIRK